MSIGESNATLCQLVYMGSNRLGMTPKTSDPVIQIINRNEKDVRFCFCLLRAKKSGQQKNKTREITHKIQLF